MVRHWLALAVVSGAAACATAAPAGGSGTGPGVAAVAEGPRREEGAETVEAVVKVDAEPGYKKFQGVWLERDGGERWVATYRPEGWLRAFEGRRVIVSGERYEPEGQAIMAQHFRVKTIRLRDVNDASRGALFVEVGAERTIAGRFVDRVGAPGTKLEGERYTVFEAEDGAAYGIVGTPEGAIVGGRVRVRARTVEMSPFVARRGGPALWILDVTGM